MRIIFVRHGHPNYKDDCLTELGHRHAEAAAERLQEENIHRFFSSTCGRAMETAEHIAARFGAEVEGLEFMREIKWGSVDEQPLAHNGHPWFTVDDMVIAGQDIWEADWEQEEPFCKNKVISNIRMIRAEFDRWLETLGYVREGKYYRVRGGSDETYLLASHGGSSMVAIAHILNLPFPLACKIIRPDFTAITVLYFKNAEGELVCPEIERMNDAGHIAGMETQIKFDN